MEKVVLSGLVKKSKLRPNWLNYLKWDRLCLFIILLSSRCAITIHPSINYLVLLRLVEVLESSPAVTGQNIRAWRTCQYITGLIQLWKKCQLRDGYGSEGMREGRSMGYTQLGQKLRPDQPQLGRLGEGVRWPEDSKKHYWWSALAQHQKVFHLHCC